MLRKLLISVASVAALGLAAPASAASIMINFGASNVIPANNDFKSNLNGLGFTHFATLGADLVADGPLKITFEYFGSESSYQDTFTAGAATYTETVNGVDNKWATPVLIGTTTFVVGAGTSLAGLINFTTSGIGSGGQNATVGQDGFGIFLKGNTMTGALTQTSGQSFTTFWFGYDDQRDIGNGGASDDNHDDFIVRATVSPIPEPATWAMMVGGVGIAGMAMRRRRRTASATVMA
jgi:PEP-CTERM motif